MVADAFTQKTFPTLVGCITFHGTFYVYAIIALLLTVWAMLTVKQTDGLSLVETERLYDGKMGRKYEAVGDSKKDYIK